VGRLRVAGRGLSYEECSIGRVAIDVRYRGLGLGRDLMERGLAFCASRWSTPVRLSAQAYLQNFYESLGFSMTRGPYLEDGIPHVEMLKPG